MLSEIYRLNKTEIVARLSAAELETTGNFETVRQRLRDHIIAENSEMAKSGGNRFQSIPSTPEPPIEELAPILNQMRKWGLHFDGKDLLSFLERVEELSAAYGYEGSRLLTVCPNDYEAMPYYGIEIVELANLGTVLRRSKRSVFTPWLPTPVTARNSTPETTIKRVLQKIRYDRSDDNA
ncbi:hypothetical protein CAJAP_08868 [Camponotus japonicus]